MEAVMGVLLCAFRKGPDLVIAVERSAGELAYVNYCLVLEGFVGSVAKRGLWRVCMVLYLSLIHI